MLIPRKETHDDLFKPCCKSNWIFKVPMGNGLNHWLCPRCLKELELKESGLETEG